MNCLSSLFRRVLRHSWPLVFYTVALVLVMGASISAQDPSSLTKQSTDIPGATKPADAKAEELLPPIKRLTVTPEAIKPASGKTATSIVITVQPSTEDKCGDVDSKIDLSTETLMIAGNAGLTLAPQPLTQGKCVIAYTATVDPNAPAGSYTLLLLSGKKTHASVDLAVIDPNAGPIPPGLRPEVDVMWEVMSQRNCADAFGKRVSQSVYCIQVKIGNNSGYALQLAGIGFSSRLKNLENQEITIANSSYASTRAVLLTENITGGRNIAYNMLQAAGVMMTAFTPYFGTGFHPNGSVNNARTNWTTAASIVSGPLLSAFNIVAPNPVITQLNNLDDQSFRDNRVISNNSHIQTVVFVEKEALTYQLAELAHKYCDLTPYGCKPGTTEPASAPTDGSKGQVVHEGTPNLAGTVKNSQNPSDRLFLWKQKGEFNPLLVKLALGSVVIVGLPIQYLERVQVVNTATPTPTSAPIITSLSSNAAGDEVTISGNNFGLSKGSGSVRFGSTPVDTFVSWSDTEIKVKVPQVAPGQVNVIVSAGAGDSAPAIFKVLPTIAGDPSPNAGAPGTKVKLTGSFGGSKGTVKFGSVPAVEYTWTSSSSIDAIVVPDLPLGPVDIVVSAGEVDSKPVKFTVKPAVSHVDPSPAAVGALVTLAGNFGADSGTLKFGSADAKLTSWLPKSIAVNVPNLSPGSTTITVSLPNGGDSATHEFTVAPSITGPLPPLAPKEQLTIPGNFGDLKGSVTIGGILPDAAPEWQKDSIKTTIPANIEPGQKDVIVVASGISSSPVKIDIKPSKPILSPTSGTIEQVVTITGQNFVGPQGSSSVKFGGISATVIKWESKSIQVKVPAVAKGKGKVQVVVTINKVDSDPTDFTVQ